MLRMSACAVILAIGLASTAAAQTVRGPADAGPPPPIAPATVTRDEQGRATIRAVRITEPLRLDGRLDEEAYTAVRAIDGLVQQLPHEGVPATELTELWVFTARLVGLRLGVAPTARLGFSALTQFNPSSHSLTSSARVRWEYTPGCELFVVYGDGRDTATRSYPGLQNRSVAVKATRLLRF